LRVAYCYGVLQTHREELEKLTAEVESAGNAERGEVIYVCIEEKNSPVRAVMASGAWGPKIGPDLVAVGAAAPTDYIVDSILRPNKAIAEQFENFQVLTKDSFVRMGTLRLKTDKEVVLYDPGLEDDVAIPSENVAKLRAMPSLMAQEVRPATRWKKNSNPSS